MRDILLNLRLATRNLFRQTGRTGMTLAAIVFGVVGIILSGGFVEDIFVQLREATIHSRTGHLQVYREGYHALGSREPFRYLMEDTGAVTAELAGLPEVKQTLQRVQFFGLLSNGRTDLPIIGEGVEPEREAALGSRLNIIEGRQLTGEDAFGVLLGEGVAGSLAVGPGDLLTVLANTPEGALNTLEFEVVGVFRTFSSDYDARAVRIALPAAQELLTVPGVHAVVVSLQDTALTEAVAERLRAGLEAKGYEVKTWLELDDFYAKTEDLYQTQLGVFQAIILVVVLLSVANSVHMTAYERVGEFGTLKALGRRSEDVGRLILLENVVLGLLGAGLGVGAGALAAWGISSVGIPMPPPPNASVGYTAYIRLVPTVMVSAFVVGLTATVLSALMAARGASRVPIIEALRQNV